MSIQLMITLATATLVGLFAMKLVKSRLAEKAKAYESRKRRARIHQQLGNGHPPSWHVSDDRRDEFFAGVHWLSTRKGVPKSYAQTVLGKEVNIRRLSWYAGLLEDQDAPWIEQQMAIADQILEWWETEQETVARHIHFAK